MRHLRARGPEVNGCPVNWRFGNKQSKTGVYKHMGQHGLKRKILGFLALAVFALLLAPFVAVQVQEWMFRYRAGRLLADMRALQLHQAGIPEIQAIFMRWNHEERPTCCWFETGLWLGPTPPDFADPESLWFRLFRMYGGRFARVTARAAVDDSRAWKSFYFEIELETSRVRGSPNEGHDVLSGVTGAAPRFSIQHHWHGLTLHPHYVVEVHVRNWYAHTPDISVQFDQQADPKDIARLATFDLSCLTRLWPCRRAGDLMPAAAAQYAREEPQLARARKEHVCSTQIISLMARDAEYVGVVTVTGHNSRGDAYVPVVRLDETFKPGSRWKIGQERGLFVFVDDDTTDWGHNLPPEVQPGRQFILVTSTSQYEPRSETVERCGIVPLNAENLQLVRQAIAKNLTPARP